MNSEKVDETKLSVRMFNGTCFVGKFRDGVIHVGDVPVNLTQIVRGYRIGDLNLLVYLRDGSRLQGMLSGTAILDVLSLDEPVTIDSRLIVELGDN